MKENFKGSFWKKAEHPLILIGTAIVTGGIGFGFHWRRSQEETRRRTGCA